MCYPFSDSSIRAWLSLWSSCAQLHSLSVINAAQAWKLWLAQMHAQRPNDRWRSPLLSLHVSGLKPMPRPRSAAPRRTVYLVKSGT